MRGFDVLDVTVRDLALQRLEQDINQHILSAKRDRLILIEFARNNYQRTFQQFSRNFLMDAYFLYLNVEIEICRKRIRQRITQPETADDFFVSEYIFTTYYNQDDGQSIPQILTREYGIEKQRVEIIDNNGLLSNSIAWINQFVDTICGLEFLGEV